MTRHPLLQKADAAGVLLWIDGGRIRWHSTRPPPADLLALMRAHRDDLVEALRPPPGAAFLWAFTEASHAALVERDFDPHEEPEREAIFGRPAQLAIPIDPMPRPEQATASSHPKRPLWESQTMEGRTLALLRTPGVEVVVERDGWLRISTPVGAYALAQRVTAERVGWRG
jgi:hypothetical protein